MSQSGTLYIEYHSVIYYFAMLFLVVCSFLLMITIMTNGVTTAHEGSKELGGTEDATMPV